MSELAASIDLAPLTEQIDELSTRLILNGVATLTPDDFECLRRSAADGGSSAAADAVQRLAESVAAAQELPVPERTRIASAGLVELRRVLDGLPADRQAGTPASPSASKTPAPPPQSDSLAADEDLVREFITESNDHLAAIDSELLLLEKDKSNPETLNTIFRGFHTIKGLAGFLEFAEIQSLAHEVETLLDLARTGQLAVTPAVVDVVLESTDIVRRELAAIGQKLAGKAAPPTAVDAALLERIRQAARGEAPGSQPVSAPIAPAPIAPANEGAAVEPPREERRVADATSVRIDTVKLDQLMDMVGEMVIAQTLIGHNPALKSVHDARLQGNLTQLARITSDVQRITTSMRMVPIGAQFNKTARLVRDLARRAGKEVVFEASGETTELDKTIAAELSDPLLHMVRNSIDHGIEPGEERISRGKDPIAHIRVSACHQSGQIVVSISDDGRGLDREKILAKARQKGLIQPDAAPPTDNEVYQLIFEPGFSTAATVSDISGRGVGMDVVRRHVQKLRGRIEIQSSPGVGTTFFIKLPLTLALIDGLVVSVGQQRYIAPIFALREMFRPTQEMLSTVQGKGEMAMVRGGLLPIVRLHRRFDVEPRTVDLTKGTLIVAESGGRAFCLFVDDLIGKQEIVIKSLGPGFKNVAGVAGCAILGDGRVGLILDLDGIYRGRA